TLGVEYSREGWNGGPRETHILGTLSLPLPLVQSNQGRRAEAQTQLRIARAERAAFSAELESRLERHRSAVAAAAVRVRTYGSEIVPSFEENLRLIQRAFELGEIDSL